MYDFYVDKYKEILSTPNRITKLPPRVMIALDKGTSRNDYGHQGVHCTVVTEEGFSKEIVLSANICGPTGQELYNDMVCTGKFFFDLSQVAAISTDGAGSYEGHNKGMVDRENLFRDKLQFLVDLCHKIELMLAHTIPGEFPDFNDKINRTIKN